ncbi:MAG: hypothetical protein JSV60_03105 [Desulfobacterales bacterium]|jgi:hypothetical protein|nr:MAG: hypothetical protein JSV60_03105 [Desulfobacterales bacterium]
MTIITLGPVQRLFIIARHVLSVVVRRLLTVMDIIGIRDRIIDIIMVTGNLRKWA